MKKIVFAAALCAVFGLPTAQAAQVADSTSFAVKPAQTDPFKAIPTDSLPQTVKDALFKDFADMTVKAAYVKDEDGVKTYKVTLANAEGTATDVLFNEKGEILPAELPAEKQQ